MLKLLSNISKEIKQYFIVVLLVLGFLSLVGQLGFTYQYADRTVLVTGECANDSSLVDSTQTGNACLYKHVTAEGSVWRQSFTLKNAKGELISYINPPIISYPITKDAQGQYVLASQYSNFNLYPLQAEATWRTLLLFFIITVIVLCPLVVIFFKWACVVKEKFKR